MTKEEYQKSLQACYACCGILRGFDLPGVLTAMAKADAIGPIIDPTLWMQKNKAMDQDKRVVEAAMHLWRMADVIETRGPR